MPICLSHPIRHVGDHLHMAPPPLRRRQPHPQGISLGTFNIRGGWDYGVTQAIWAVQVGRFDVMLMTDTKITDQAYCCNRLGYDVV